MISAEIKVNGTMVGHIYARNISTPEVLESGVGLNLYHWEYYKPENRIAKRGKVSHERQDGIEKLISKILAEAT
jgi:hypothetical protein